MIRGLRVHLTGSAARKADGALLHAAHSFVQSLAKNVISAGGGLVVGAGDEPRADCGQPCIFDWTVLEVVAQAPDPAPDWPASKPRRFVAVASQRGLEKVPADRIGVWRPTCSRSDFELAVAPPGWRMAGIIRERQVRRGDILVALGGGAGVEHLAERYREEGKPVVPIFAELGALSNDGNGGSRFLHQRAMGDPDAFLRLHDRAGSTPARLDLLRLNKDCDPCALADESLQLLAALRPPSAFYVRLLANDHPDYAEVERFFREAVDVVIASRGFTPREMGRERPERAFINVEIFEALHRAGLVVVDLTGVRPNCMMELGYALARCRRVVISAKRGTQLPFDEDKLPTYLWDDVGTLDQRILSFADWLDRYSELPPLVE